MTGVKIGVIAEENNDIDVLYELTCKLTSESNSASVGSMLMGAGN